MARTILAGAMVILAGALLAAEWEIRLQWFPGQELVYRGEIHELASGRGIQFRKEYTLEIRALALQQRGEDIEVAFLTTVRPKVASPGPAESGTVRLELAWVSPRGEIIAPNRQPPTLSLDGPTTWECGFVVRLPNGAFQDGQSWRHQEPGQPPEEWRVLGGENVASTTCLKLLRIQKSEEWEKPRGDRRAWYRREVLWIEPRLGLAQRLERELARREPAHLQATGSIVTRYELVSTLRYEPKLFEECRREIALVAQVQEQLRDLLTPGRKTTPDDFQQLVRRVEGQSQRPPTPYRPALDRLKSQAQSAAQGEIMPVAAQEPLTGLEIGKPAPDFLVPDWHKGQQISLHQFRGRPTLLLFLQPRSPLSGEILLYARRLVRQNPDWDVRPVVLVMQEDREGVKDLLLRREWEYPVLLGQALRASYQIDATPRIVVLDGQGIVQGHYTGWGPEIPQLIVRDLQQLVNRK